MGAVRGQPAPKPGSLTKPVPGAEAQSEADAFLADFDAPEVAAPGGAPDADSADAFLNSMDEGAAAPPSMEREAEPGFIQANINQFNPQNFIDRLQTGFAANDTEKVNFLKKKYGDGNVVEDKGKIYYRRNPKDKLKALDPGTLEVIADIIPDFAREIVTEASMLPGEILGGIAGTFAGGPAGAAAGATAGRVASVPLANKAADEVASAVGVNRDDTRSALTENAIGMGAEAVLPVVGRQLVKRIPGTALYKAAREAGEKEVVALSKQSQEVLQAAQSLETEGINTPMMLHQIQPDSPKLAKTVSGLQDYAPFINKQREFAEGYGEALNNTLNEIKRRGGHDPVQAGKLAQTVTNAVESLDASEGKAIGHYRARALAKLGNQKQQLPAESSQTVVELMKELGFQPKRSKLNVITRPGTYERAAQRGGVESKGVVERVNWVPPKDLQPIIGRLGLDDTQTRQVVNALNEYGQLVSRGNEARLTDVERLIKRMGPLNRKLQGSALAGTWGKLTGDLRSFRREMIGNSLGDPTEKALYNRVMDDFSMIRSNTEQLGGALRGDVTAKTIVSSFFKGKENLANIRALKAITGNDSAQWGALKEEFVNQLMVKHSSDGPTGFNSGAFLKDLQQNYGDDFIREVLNDGKAGPNLDTVKNLLTVGKRIEAIQKGVRADSANEKVKQGVVDAGIGLIAGIKFKAVNGIMSLLGANTGQEKALFEILNREGFEKYLGKYPSKDKARIARTLEEMMMKYNAAREGSRKVKAVTDIGKELGVRGGRAAVKEDLMRSE